MLTNDKPMKKRPAVSFVAGSQKRKRNTRFTAAHKWQTDETTTGGQFYFVDDVEYYEHETHKPLWCMEDECIGEAKKKRSSAA